MKPVGIFSPHAGIPDWASFAILGDWQDLAWAHAFAAGRQAAGRPFAWVLYLTGQPREVPVAEWVPSVRERLAASGVLPYVAAVILHEEWYAACRTLAEIDATHAWLTAQHLELKRLFPSQALIMLDAYVTPPEARALGHVYYRPEPPVDLRCVYTYVPQAHTWESALMEPKIALACGYQVGPYRMDRKPVVLVTQAFQIDGDPSWGAWPTDVVQAHAARWAADPAVLAIWPFDYASRPWSETPFRGHNEWPGRGSLAAWGVQ